MRSTIARVATAGLAMAAVLAGPALAQDGAPARPERPTAPPERTDADRRADAVRRGVELLLEMQEGDGKDQWPYEGVYRVRGEIPVGYRVGGTAICALALLQAPGYADDAARQEAMDRAVRFVCDAADHPLMSAEKYQGGYDVRGWGYCYALQLLVALKQADAVPPGLEDTADAAARHYVDALQRTEIPQVGGWNYARPPGADRPAPSSPFMTAPCLRALFAAHAAGYEVDAAVVERALSALESSRTASGAFAYSAARDGERRRDGTPGAVGRMLAGECTLYLAGRSDTARVRGAVDAFLAHWDELDKRRAQNGTHVAPFGVAPYYFYYAHLHAAEAIELLPEHERRAYRQRLEDLLFRVRLENGAWNDRVFGRSANYGTAMAVMALLAPTAERPVGWSVPAQD